MGKDLDREDVGSLGEHGRILVVDDNDGVHRTIEMELAPVGYTIDQAMDGD